MKFNPVTEYSIPTEELHPCLAYDRGFIHGQEFAKFQERERIIDLLRGKGAVGADAIIQIIEREK